MKISKIILVILFFINILQLNAEEILVGYDTIWSKNTYGAFLHIGKTNYTANFSDLTELQTCCPSFTNGEGYGLNFGFLYEYNYSKLINLSSRIGYYSLNGELTDLEPKLVNVNGQAASGIFQHKLQSNLSYLSIEPLVNFKIYDYLSIYSCLILGFYKTSKSYDYGETILQPDDGTFENGSRSRLVSSGNFDNFSDLTFGVSGGISYNLPINKSKNLTASLELFYNYYFNKVYNSTNWYADVLRLGISIKYNPFEIIPKYETVPDITKDTIKIIPQRKESWIKADIFEKSIDNFSIENDCLKIEINELYSFKFRPLLPFVFFEESNFSLQNKYSRITSDEAEKFEITMLKDSNIINTYYHLLNIIGKRMNIFPDAKIILEGSNDNINESGNLDLSESRAIAVRNYLENVWNISRNRIEIKKRNLPRIPSNSSHIEGIEENRRVEIIPNDWRIIAPVEIRDTIREVHPSILRFYPITESDTTIKSREISIEFSEYLKQINLKQNENFFDWDIQHDIQKIEKIKEIKYQLNAENDANKFAKSQIKKIDVKYNMFSSTVRNIVNGKYVDEYMLIYFPFDEFFLTDINQKIIDYIKENFSDESEIFVNGYTDKTGDNQYNEKLSLDRAKSTSKFIRENGIKHTGFGEDTVTFDNNTPEGRFYSRRVDIRIETPVEKSIENK